MSDAVSQSAQGDPRLTAFCVVGGVALCMATVAALLGLGAAPSFTERAQALTGRMARLEAAGASAGPANRYPRNAVCSAPAVDEAQSLQTRLQELGRRLKLAQVQVHTDAADVEGQVQPVEFGLEANGDYAGALNVLRALALERPVMSLERVDMTSNGSFLHLRLHGRSYCWSRAHP